MRIENLRELLEDMGFTVSNKVFDERAITELICGFLNTSYLTGTEYDTLANSYGINMPASSCSSKSTVSQEAINKLCGIESLMAMLEYYCGPRVTQEQLIKHGLTLAQLQFRRTVTIKPGR